METPPQFYNIRDLVLLPELNPRTQLCEETISRYMESFDSLPPVSIQEGTGVLVDGFHRVEAATRLGAEAIPVRMLDIPDEELHLYAGLGNCGHGRALNRAERNRFIVRLIEQYQWSGDKVARVIGVSASSVSLALREHQYNQALTERLGEEVQVINSAHVQALYRVGPEQRAQLLDAVAGKIDDEGRPRPLTGAELKSLVDRMEDPQIPAEELKRLLADPSARPEPSARRPVRSSGQDSVSVPERAERRGPLRDHRHAPSTDSLRAPLLERALTRNEEPPSADRKLPDRQEIQESWVAERSIRTAVPAKSAEDDAHTSGSGPDSPAPVRLDQPKGQGEAVVPPMALPDWPAEERGAADALREAERLLCDLCARVEDAEFWDQLCSARDLVREAAALLGG